MADTERAAIIPARALREIYLEPFRLIMKHTQATPPRCWMTAYNLVNGVHASECKFLLDDVLRKEWGFKGLIMSDWTGVFSTAESIKAGASVTLAWAMSALTPECRTRH